MKMIKQFFFDYNNYMGALKTHNSVIIDPLKTKAENSFIKIKNVDFVCEENKKYILNILEKVLKEKEDIENISITIKNILRLERDSSYDLNKNFIENIFLNELKADSQFLMDLMYEYKFSKINEYLFYVSNECFYNFVMKNKSLLSEDNLQEIALIKYKSNIAKRFSENFFSGKNSLSFTDSVKNFIRSVSFYREKEDRELSDFFYRLRNYDYTVTPERFFSKKNEKGDSVFDEIFKTNPEKASSFFMKNKDVLKKINLDNTITYLLQKENLKDDELFFLSYSLSMKMNDPFLYLNKEGKNLLLEKIINIKSREHILLRKIQTQRSNLYSELSKANKLKLIKKQPCDESLILSIESNIGAIVYSSIISNQEITEQEKKQLIDNYKGEKIIHELKKDLERISDHLKVKEVNHKITVKEPVKKRKIRI